MRASARIFSASDFTSAVFAPAFTGGLPGLPCVTLMLNALPAVRIVPSSGSFCSTTQPSLRKSGSASDSSIERTGCIVISACAAASVHSFAVNFAMASARIGW